MVGGLLMIVYGLYTALVPQEVLDLGPIGVSTKEGFTDQTLGMIGIGVLGLLAGALVKFRR